MPPRKFEDLKDREVGRWTVQRYEGSRRTGRDRRLRHYWLCRCACGRTRPVEEERLKRGTSQSCGICTRARHCRRHGASFKKKTKRQSVNYGTYKVWGSLVTRCRNRGHSTYAHYGARGVRLHEPWYDFKQFLAEVGRRPTPRHQLRRIDTAGHFEPGNVRWVDRSTNQYGIDMQQLTWRDFTQSAVEWASDYKLAPHTLRSRIRTLARRVAQRGGDPVQQLETIMGKALLCRNYKQRPARGGSTARPQCELANQFRRGPPRRTNSSIVAGATSRQPEVCAMRASFRQRYATRVVLDFRPGPVRLRLCNLVRAVDQDNPDCPVLLGHWTQLVATGLPATWKITGENLELEGEIPYAGQVLLPEGDYEVSVSVRNQAAAE